MAWNEPGGQSNDPWSGRNRQQGPPNLDEVLKKLFGNVFKKGGSKPNGQGGSDDGDQGWSKFSIAMVVIGLVAAWLLSGIYIVGPAEQAVVLRFGKYVETVDPGPHWILPVVQSKRKVNVRQVEKFSYSSHMLTGDENIVDVSVNIQYRVSDPQAYLFNVIDPRASILQATASALRQVIGHSTLDDTLTTGRAVVRQQVTTQLNQILDLYQTGLYVVDVNLQSATAPDAVKEAFDDAIRAQEDEQRFINQAQEYARKVEPIAKGRAQRILAQADAYKQQVTLAAQGETARYLFLLPEYKRAPTVTTERLYLDAMENVLAKTSKVLVDVEGGNSLLYLPLEQLVKQAMPEKQSESDEAKAQERDSSSVVSMASSSWLNQQRARQQQRQQRGSYQGRGQ